MQKRKLAPYTPEELNTLNIALELLQSCLKETVSYETFARYHTNYDTILAMVKSAQNERTERLNRKFWNRKN